MHGLSRREFLRNGAALAAASAAPTLFTRSALAAPDRPAASNRIVMGCIGVRNMGGGHLNTLLNNQEVQVAAICDVDAAVRNDGLQKAEKAYAQQTRSGEFKGVQGYNDFRELLARPDIDAVMIAVPDQWHALIAAAAVRAGKDVYLEKPMTLTIAEGQTLSQIVRRYGRVLQVGSQQRSGRDFRLACELVRNGRIGKLHTIEVKIPTGKACDPVKPMPVPEGFDYDLWLGPAPAAPYTELRCHYNFRFNLDYSGGQMTNFGAHDLDIAQWALDADNSGPVEIEGKGNFPAEGLWNTALSVDVKYTYANGVKVLLTTGSSGVRFEGSEGWIYVNRGTLQASDKSILTSVIGPGEVHLYQSPGHWANFFDCVRTRRDPVATVEIGHRSATVCHLGNIAMHLGRKVQWDPARERFVNDEEADRMIARAMRGPWHL